MPTLMFAPESHPETGTTGTSSRNEGDAGEDGSSTTMYHSDESTIFDENLAPNTSNHHNECSAKKSVNAILRDAIASPILREKHNKSVTFDESFVLLSTKKRGRYSRRDTLNSDVSLLSCDNSLTKERNIPEVKSNNRQHSDNEAKEEPRALASEKSDRAGQRSRKDEYHQKYQPYVKATVSEFESKFPGKLRDYRSMSLEEKSAEQQKVLALLTRLGVSRHDAGSNSTIVESSFKSPVHNRRMVDETLSPMFSPNLDEPGCGDRSFPSSPLSEKHNRENDQSSIHLDQSRIQCEKSELLLSLDDGDASGAYLDPRIEQKSEDSSGNSGESGRSDVDFPIDNDRDGFSSDGSMELVRRAAVDDTHYSDRRLSCTTPERTSTSNNMNRKREASSSGKRGADLRRSRYNEKEEDYGHIGHKKDDTVDLCAPFGRLSISPSLSTPPKDLFITSQSPISPRLTYHSPNTNDSDDYSDGNYTNRISLGRDSNDYRESNRRNSRRNSNIANDSLATNTPSKRYRSEKDKRRAFREVPVNVVLKKGATFHLEKIAVKRTERISSNSGAPKDRHTKAKQRRRLVNFPDPLVRYSSRRRRALKEMYSWVRRAEKEYEEGRCIVPAVGAFFSLSEQQIIDVSLKFFLNDFAEKSHEIETENIQSTSVLKGNTLVVVRTKDDTVNWESALREGTGCSVLNHSSLPLSDRIRGSTAEKACMYDVVLTTYDSVKSPDFAMAVTNTGRAILTKSETDGGWQSSRSTSQQENNQTKKLSVLHRIQFKRIIFVDALGRKCYLAKGGTARAAASVALSSSSCRLVFFKETEADGSNALLALRKSDKGAFQSVSSVLHLADHTSDSSSDTGDETSDDEKNEDPLENIAMDLKDLVC